MAVPQSSFTRGLSTSWSSSPWPRTRTPRRVNDEMLVALPFGLSLRAATVERAVSVKFAVPMIWTVSTQQSFVVADSLSTIHVLGSNLGYRLSRNRLEPVRAKSFHSLVGGF